MAEEAKTPEQETESYEVFVTEAVGDQPEGDTQKTQGEGSAKAQDDGDGQQDGQDVSAEEGKDEADKEAADNAGEVQKPKGKARNSYQKRIDRLTKRAKEAEDELKRIRAQGKQPEGDNAKADTDTSTDEPDPSDFDSYDDYLDSLADWKAGQKKGKVAGDGKDKGTDDNAQDQDQEEDTEYTEALEDVTEAFDESREKYDDFDEVVTAPDVQITKDMVKALADSDNPGDVAYYLGKHKDEASRIAGLSPLAQAREIGKLEAKVANMKPPGKKTTQAPDPIEPVRGSDSSSKSAADMDFSEYERTMNERERNGRGFW